MLSRSLALPEVRGRSFLSRATSLSGEAGTPDKDASLEWREFDGESGFESCERRKMRGRILVDIAPPCRSCYRRTRDQFLSLTSLI